MAMHVFHEPVDMQQVMREVKPGIKHEQINECLKQELSQSELVLFSCPVSVVWSQGVYFP